MKPLVVPLVVILAVAGLLDAQVTPARACVCVGYFNSPERLDFYLQSFDLIVIGVAEPPPPAAEYDGNVYVRAERLIKGPRIKDIPTTQPLSQPVDHTGPTECGYQLDPNDDSRHVFAFDRPGGAYSVAPCGSFSVDGLVQFAPDFYRRLEAIAQSLATPESSTPAAPDGGVAPGTTGSDSGGFPALPVAAAALAGAITLLLGASFIVIIRRRIR